MRYRITAPVATFSGVVAGAVFSQGVAEVEDSNGPALAYCRRKGYDVQPVEPAPVAADEPEGPPKRPNSAATKDALVAYAVNVLQMPESEATDKTRPELLAAIDEHHNKETEQ